MRKRKKDKTMTILHEIWVERKGDRMFAVTTENNERFIYVADTFGELLEVLNAELREYYDPKAEARRWHFGGVEEVYHRIGKVYDITKS